MICIGCPVGCGLIVQQNNNEINVSGHQCNLGDSYGKEEMTNPTRNIATSIRVIGGDMPMLSVKTCKPIPKGAIISVVKAIHQLTLTAPISIGDVVLTNAADTGVDIVATRNVPKVVSS